MNFEKIVELIKKLGYFAEKSVQGGKDCIIVSESESDEVKAVIYTKEFEDLDSDYEIAREIINKFEKSVTPDSNKIVEQLKNKENRLILPCLRQRGLNTYPDIVSSKFLDMELYYRIFIDLDGEESGGGSIVITKPLAESLGLSNLDLYTEANNNVEKYARINSLLGMMNFIGYNYNMPFGAGAITNSNILYEAYEKFGEFYLIPSSTDEMLVVPDVDEIDPSRLSSMIREINGDPSIISGDMILSYSVYYFDGAELTIVEV